MLQKIILFDIVSLYSTLPRGNSIHYIIYWEQESILNITNAISCVAMRAIDMSARWNNNDRLGWARSRFPPNVYLRSTGGNRYIHRKKSHASSINHTTKTKSKCRRSIPSSHAGAFFLLLDPRLPCIPWSGWETEAAPCCWGDATPEVAGYCENAI